jgi:FHS family Na+ dependent glucose MFS transporter 1
MAGHGRAWLDGRTWLGSRKWHVVLYCFVQFLNGSCVNIVGPAGKTLESRLHTTHGVGSILSAEGAGNLTAALLIGVVLPRFAGHSILRTLLLCLFCCLVGVALCSSIVSARILYFGVGCCLGLGSGTANTLVTWVYSGRNVGPWVNLINACFGLGSSSAPLLFLAVERRAGSGMHSFSAIGCLAAATALAASLLHSPSPPPPKLGPAAEAEASPHEEAAPRRLGLARGGSSLMGIDLGSRRAYVQLTVMTPLMVLMTLGVGGEIAYGAWIFSYATERAGMPSAEAAYLNSFYWSAFTLGRLSLIPCSAVATPELLLLATVGLEVGVSGVALIAAHDSARVLWAVTALLAVGVCAIYSNVVSLLSAYDLLTPGSVSMLQVACGVGHMTVPFGVSVVMRHTSLGYDALFHVLVVTNSICLATLAAVVVHLRRNFTPAMGSIRAAQLARRESFSDDCREARRR